MGDEASFLGELLVAPPVDDAQIERYFGDVKGVSAIDELITIVTRGVPVKTAPLVWSLYRALQYGNSRNVVDDFPPNRETLSEDVRLQKRIVITKSASHEILNLRKSLLGAVVTHKVRIINKLSFEAQNKSRKRGLNTDIMLKQRKSARVYINAPQPFPVIWQPEN